MIGLYGRYEKTLDAKNRLIVPNTIRKKLKDEEMVLVGWFDRCLALFPASVFEGIANKVSQLQVPSEKVRGMRRQFFGSAFNVEFDGQGRISIPDYLLRYAFINGSREVVLIGDYDKLEIWPKARFEEFDERNRVNVNEDFEQTLTQVANITQGNIPKNSESSEERGEIQ